jgi:DNA-binding FadR family transcriptional regulator
LKAGLPDKRLRSGAIKRERLHDQVTRNIALRILRGSPDDIESVLTTELDLCRYLGVSRSILRESIKVLADKGLVEVRPKTGIRVRPRSDWNLLDSDLLRWQCEAGIDRTFIENLYQVRLLLEPSTARAAASRASEEEIGSIFDLYQRMERNLSDFETYVNADVEFHHAISRATHNDFLIYINETIFGALRGSQEVFKKQRAGAAKALPLHHEVAVAIRQRKPEAAESAMYRLVKQAESDILLMLEEHDNAALPPRPDPRNAANPETTPLR